MEDKITRRAFLKSAAAGAVAAGALSCGRAAAGSSGEGPGEMETRVNHVSGDKVSLLGYGCMRWPMIKDASGKDVIDQEKVNEMVDYAMAHGINYYDTSPAYLQGQSERAAGIALSRYPRESYYIATKLSNFGNPSPEASIKMYRDSFGELRTEYFDYYLLHAIGGGGREAFERRYVNNGIMEFLYAEKAAGRIRNLGFSFHGNKDSFDYFMSLHDNGTYHWDFCQIEMNYVDWTHADGKRNVNADYLYAELVKRNIPIVVMEPLLGGRLANVPANIATRLKTLEPDRSAAWWAFRFVGSWPGVLCILSGMTSMDPLKENVETFGHFKPMDDKELALMEEMAVLMKEYPMVNCTSCKYCMPCPYGIDIPGIFHHYNRSVTDGTFVTDSSTENYRKLRRAFLLGYDRAVPPERQADHCISCGTCLSHCPQSIPIPGELARINRYVEKLKQGKI